MRATIAIILAGAVMVILNADQLMPRVFSLFHPQRFLYAGLRRLSWLQSY